MFETEITFNYIKQKYVSNYYSVQINKKCLVVYT